MNHFPDFECGAIDRMISSVVARDGLRTFRILDVGCGFGRNLSRLSERGYAVVGVDANEISVAYLRALGLACYLPHEDGWQGEYDAILMSHIVEHFPPEDLVEFVEGYLRHLKPGGHLVIATPLLTEYFYDDFTHVRPYPPESLMMIFGGGNRQVCMHSRCRLELLDLWFRSSAFKLRRTRSRYLGVGRPVIKALNALLAAAHLASLGIVGQKDGWVGLFVRTD